MRNLKKFLALVLAMMMTLSLMVTVNASSFKDNDDVTKSYNEAVDVLSKMGVINGYSDGTFLPKEKITRAEVAAIIYRITTGDVGNKNIHLYQYKSEFTDVADGLWYVPYINYCANNGLVNGVGGNRFAPKANVTGYEALVMILRAIGYNNPTEFSSSDWKFKASGYGSRLEITKNIPAGSLGGEATREMVAEIMFKGILAPMVKYSPLTQYTTDLLVDASEVNAQYDRRLYREDVPNTLMYQTFKIVGKRTNDNFGMDVYGRPQVEWVKDLSTDTVANGGKYIPNYQKVDGTADTTMDGSIDGGDATINWWAQDTRATPVPLKGIEPTAMAIPMTPVKIYHDVVTECQLTKDVNADTTIKKAALTEYLNGALVDNSSRVDLDINHTQEGTIGAPGRTTEIYKYTKNGSTKWDFVYIDNLLGVVTNVTKRNFDTAGNHVMEPAKLTVKVNSGADGGTPAAVEVIETDSEADFPYNVGDLVILNTWGMMTDGTKDAAVAGITAGPAGNVQVTVPGHANDFLADNSDTDGWSVETIGKPTTANITVKGTLGDKNHKTGLEATDGKNYMGNVVYLANRSATTIDTVTTGIDYKYNEGGASLATDRTTVPSTSPFDYGYRMVNAAINQTYTVVLDDNGYVIGMTAAEIGTDIGVVSEYEPVRIGTGKWAVEVTLFMSDGSEKTVRMLAGSKTKGSYTAPDSGTEPVDYVYFDNSNDADTNFKAANLGIDKGALVKIQAYTKDGATYYKPVETHLGAWTNYAKASIVSADNNNVETGVADTLTAAAITYSPRPTHWANNTLVVNNVDDNTQFIIAQVNWDYSLNENNKGGYDDLELNVYSGFKNIPTVTGGSNNVKYQRIDNTVYVHPDELDDDLVYTVKKQVTYPVDETYLVYATGATYQNYSVYKALKDGEPVDLKVSNRNLTLVNSKIETAMARATVALVTVTSETTNGYATDVDVLNVAATTGGATRTRTIAGATNVSFDKTGVMHVNNVASHPTDVTDTTGVNFLTVNTDLKVVIVNLETGNYYPATQDSIKQYENYDAGSHQFVYELDEHGYISVVYIID